LGALSLIVRRHGAAAEADLYRVLNNHWALACFRVHSFVFLCEAVSTLLTMNCTTDVCRGDNTRILNATVYLLYKRKACIILLQTLLILLILRVYPN
jgi:hypothetical protein